VPISATLLLPDPSLMASLRTESVFPGLFESANFSDQQHFPVQTLTLLLA